MEPEIIETEPTSQPDASAEKRSCEKCGSINISITPVPGLWLQYSCDDCDHWWWETQDGEPITPAAPRA